MKIWSLALLLISVTAQAQESYQAWAEKACAHIAMTYLTCEKKFEYVDGVFNFPTLGTKVVCTDGARKSFYDRVNNMDMASILMIPYQSGAVTLPEVRKNHDPGRLRSEDLLMAVYGKDEARVWSNIVKVQFLGHSLSFQKKLGAARALENISKELLLEMKKDKSLADFLSTITAKTEKPSTYNWRVIEGTTRHSVHSFGIGIDIVISKVKAQYWVWDERTKTAKPKINETDYENMHFIPSKTPYFHPKAVAIFEKNGFIWGGKWNHYDTMHFEYRPEFFKGYKINCK